MKNINPILVLMNGKSLKQIIARERQSAWIFVYPWYGIYNWLRKVIEHS